MSDVLFENFDVCILNPTSPRGILIFTVRTSKNICDEGILSYNEVRRRYPERGLQNRKSGIIDSRHNDTIFFRAPYNSDTTTFETSYDLKPPKEMLLKGISQSIALLRIDPAKTFVYSSELRVVGNYYDLRRSRISMTDYLSRIRGHSTLPLEYGEKMCSNLITYEKIAIDEFESCEYPYEDHLPIERMAEVLVELPRIPPEWLFSCDTNSAGGGKKKRKTRKNRSKK